MAILQAVERLTNPGGSERDLNSGHPNYKSTALTTRPRSLLIYIFKKSHKKTVVKLR